MKDELVKENNCAYFKEYDLGHIGLVIPKEKRIFLDMLALLKNYTDPSKITVPESFTADFSSAESEVEQILTQIRQ